MAAVTICNDFGVQENKIWVIKTKTFFLSLGQKNQIKNTWTAEEAGQINVNACFLVSTLVLFQLVWPSEWRVPLAI